MRQIMRDNCLRVEALPDTTKALDIVKKHSLQEKVLLAVYPFSVGSE